MSLFVICLTEIAAQRISALSISEATSLSGFAHSNGTATTSGLIELVYPEDINLDYVTPIVTYSSTETKLKSPAVFPTDLSNADGTAIMLTANNIDYPYLIKAKTIKPLSLPFELKFGSTIKPSTWNNSDEASKGWAGALLAETSGGTPKISNVSHSLIVAFSDIPRFCAYTITSSGTIWDRGNIVSVESTSTGESWTLLRQYNSVDTMACSTALEEDRLHGVDVPADARYIRFHFTKRASGYFTVNNIIVTKKILTDTGSITTNSESSRECTPELVQTSSTLRFVGCGDIVRIDAFSLLGQLIYSGNDSVDKSVLPDGYYIFRIMFSDGKYFKTKVRL
ncbi:MAG: hypothetical protein VB102_04435 [Paludibacter sp.]|nr:hypothetical protein [Paludibacter sp.]